MRGQKSSFAGSALVAIDEGISGEESSVTKDFRQRIRTGHCLKTAVLLRVYISVNQ